MKAFVFPGQGAQFSGMGKDLYNDSQEARLLFDKADEILGFKLSEIMFSGTDEDLRRTDITQPAVFLHSVAVSLAMGDAFQPDMVAGHSLGEFSALVACGALSFEDGLLSSATEGGSTAGFAAGNMPEAGQTASEEGRAGDAVAERVSEDAVLLSLSIRPISVSLPSEVYFSKRARNLWTSAAWPHVLQNP